MGILDRSAGLPRVPIDRATIVSMEEGKTDANHLYA